MGPGKPGPAPKSTDLKIAQGTPGGKSNLNIDQPVSPTVDSGVQPPKWLSKPAIEIWNEVIPILTEMKCITKADLPLVARYCDITLIYRRLRKKLGVKFVVKGINKSGKEYEQVNQMLYALGVQHTNLMKVELQLGLTPASRSAINIKSGGGLGGGEDPIGNFLFGNRKPKSAA